MRVLIVNTSEKTGGAAVASNRLMAALNNNGVKAKMLVRDKETDNISVASLPHPWLNKWPFLWERWRIYCALHFSRKRLFEIDTACSGVDITSLPEFKEADVIHLAWINQGMLSISGIRKIVDSGKPVVWTMHDMWPATSICHYPGNCGRYHSHCANCPLLPGGGSSRDLSWKVWNRKRSVLKEGNIYFVTCSDWLMRQAKSSGLFLSQHISSIPNPIDTHQYQPADKHEARIRTSLPADKKIILFVSQKVTDTRKGMSYFVEAVEKLVAQHPDMKETTCIAILGGHSEELEGKLALPVYPLGYVSDHHMINNVYNSADLFVLPSLEDNLPNTIMEAMACGVPCVSFRIGGIPEMIDHQSTGYLARPADSSDLARGMEWVLCEADAAMLSHNAVHKVQTRYSQHAVAMRYIDVYNQAMAFRNYHL